MTAPTPSAMLVWTGSGTMRRVAPTGFGEFYVVHEHTGFGWYAHLTRHTRDPEKIEVPEPRSEDQARAACEADYARRYREAGLVPAGEVERLREALAPFGAVAAKFASDEPSQNAVRYTPLVIYGDLIVGDFRRARAALTATPPAPVAASESPSGDTVSADVIRAEIAWQREQARKCHGNWAASRSDPYARGLYHGEANVHDETAARLSALLPKPAQEEQI